MERNRAATFFLGVLTLFAVGVVLKTLKPVILPLVIAWFVSYLVNPAADLLTRKKVPRGLAIFLVLIFFFFVCYVLVLFLHGRVSSLASAFPKYQAKFAEISADIGTKIDIQKIPLSEVNWGKQIRGLLLTLTGSLVSILSNLLMVIIFLVFLMIGRPYFGFKVRNALSGERAGQVAKILESISSQISRYLSVQFFISLTTGILVSIALALIGVDFAITWGSLAFFLNFIPTIGSILASVPPILLAFIQFYPSVWPGVITLLAVLGIQMVIGNGISPKVMGDQLNLSSVVVLFSLLFWGWLWGIVGALLSIPIASAIKILCEEVEELRPIGIMMGSGKRFISEVEK